MDKSVKFRIELETNGEKVLHTLSVDADDFKKAIGDAVNETQHLSTAISSLTEGAVLLSSLNSIMSQMSSSVGILANDFNTFDKSMRAVNTMAGKDTAGMAELKGQVEELADAIPLAKGGMAIGLCASSAYCAAYAGVGVASAMELKDRQWGGRWDWIDWSLTVAGAAAGWAARLLAGMAILGR